MPIRLISDSKLSDSILAIQKSSGIQSKGYRLQINATENTTVNNLRKSKSYNDDSMNWWAYEDGEKIWRAKKYPKTKCKSTYH